MQDTINIAAVDDLPADLERLMDRLLRRLRLEEYIDLSATAASVRVPADEVLYAEVLNHRMRLLTRAGEFLLRMTVEELKPMLPKDGRFYECHRGIVINLDAVGTAEPYSGFLSVLGFQMALQEVRHSAGMSAAGYKDTGGEIGGGGRI